MAGRLAIGIDSGSAAVSVVAMDEGGSVAATAYEYHKGRISSCLEALLAKLLPEGAASRVDGVARTTSSASLDLPTGAALEVDGRVAEIESLRRFHPQARTLLVVGAERFSRTAFDEDGRYRRMRGNSSCAAGTGSFLDQQAARLGLAGGSARLAALALENRGEYPPIASRCSVFAKTDLIHAQAEGWSVAGICEGLCHGLARNIADTLFPGESPDPPIVMAGGVSRNAAVLRHLSALALSPIAADENSHLYGAMGACIRLIATGAWAPRPLAVGEIRIAAKAERKYANPALELPGGGYPDFASRSLFLHVARKNGQSNPVEVEVYAELEALKNSEGAPLPVLLGLDVGSTSTKAALLSPDGRILAGFYTRTAGKPLEAVQSLFEAVERVEAEAGASFAVALAATTGSGRKLAGSVIGADATIDEITAHARAAVELDPLVDTIIEIGGQDSKFTVLKEGIVSFSQMNAVCAAGTGSFLEEQAERLGVPLADFADRALGAPSPAASDRCTVFMERDLNHLQSLGYSTEDLLAASLFSVCDNYLSKVAREGLIGKRITFQGATAKNRALVAAFERRLGKGILVSKYCHLTGAIGAALQARDEAAASGAPGAAAGAGGGAVAGHGAGAVAGHGAGAVAGHGGAALRPRESSFRGFGLHRLELSSRTERCGICANDCRLRIVDVGGEEVAFGFLCGRDYGTKRFVRAGAGDDPLRERERAIASAYRQARKGAFPKLGYPCIGIPTALYMADDAPFWRSFFEILGFPTHFAPDDGAVLREGKRLAGAEFCAPMAMFYGQARKLLDSADFAFLPIYLEEKPDEAVRGSEARGAARGEARREYCNYSQYASVVARCAESKDRVRILSPLLKGRRGDTSMALGEMRNALKIALAPWGLRPPSEAACAQAYAACVSARAAARAEIRRIFVEGRKRRPLDASLRSPGAAPDAAPDEIGVVLVGRPYAVLSEAMGASIADMIAARGVDLAYSDMLPEAGSSEIDPLLASFHWRYASEILTAADFCAREARYYPVFVTTFKCSPDAFALEWFRRILDKAGKPYLVLQIDEHDSSVGYETRIEAALRSFSNHLHRSSPAGGGPREGAAEGNGRAKPLSLVPRIALELRGKTVLLPNWDPLVCPLLAANLRGSGIDARTLEESPAAIRRAMGWNTGQCIPISIIARECVEYVEREGLDPSKVVLWITAGSWPCNLPLYPHFIQAAFEKLGGGMEEIGVFCGDITFLYVGPRAMIGAYHAFMAGGTLRRLACRIRPYELEKGATERQVAEALAILIAAFEENAPKETAYREAFDPFRTIPTGPRNRPKVAIFGDLYVRDNDVMNQGLEAAIEEAGGEAITTPYIDYIKATLDSHFKHLLIDRSYGEWAKTKAALAVVAAAEKALSIRDHATFGKPSSWRNPSFLEKLERFGIRPDHEGECFDNALKIFRILDEHPDTALFVQANPAFCCPSIVTEAMAREIERVTGVPILTITYDGTGTPKNDAIVPYLSFTPRSRRRSRRQP